MGTKEQHINSFATLLHNHVYIFKIDQYIAVETLILAWSSLCNHMLVITDISFQSWKLKCHKNI